MSLPNRLQNISNNRENTMDTNITGNSSNNRIMKNDCDSANKLPITLDTSEEEGQLYLEMTKYVTTTIARYKMTQFKQFFNESLYKNSQYNDEGFQ